MKSNDINIILPFIKKSYANIFEDFYNITNGNIILGGSLSLRLQGIIDRDINDIDLNIAMSDWNTYQPQITKKYKIYHGAQMSLQPLLEYRISTCLTKENNNKFHLFINNIETNLYNIVVYNDVIIKVFKPELHLLDKECMLADDITNKKNISDIECIKKYLNEK
jgi:hypothetical protein